MVDGRRVVVTFEADDEQAAIAQALELERRPELLEAGAWEQEVERCIVAQQAAGRLSESYARVRRNVLRKAGRDMGLEAPRELTEARARAWYEGEVARRGTRTANHYLAHLRVFARWLVEGRRLHVDPVAKVRPRARDERRREVFLTAAEVGGVVRSARELGDAELELIVLLACEAGLRHGEISAARADWVNLEAGTITVPAVERDETWRRKGRTGRRRAVTVPMVPALRAWFDEHGVPEPFLLRPEKGWGKFLYRYEFRKKLRRFLAKQGHPEVTIHDLRRSFGSNRVGAGVSLEKVAHWMGIHPHTAWKHYARFMPADEEIRRGAAEV